MTVSDYNIPNQCQKNGHIRSDDTSMEAWMNKTPVISLFMNIL
jgi:hypothetical protein